MAATCGIYKITSPTGKIYIGQSINIANRFSYYRRLACGKQRMLLNSLKKHGVAKHVFEIIHTCKREELNALEIQYINKFDCFNTKHGLNLRTGGAGGTPSTKTRQLLRAARLGKTASEQTKHNMREAAKKRPPMNAETKLKHSISSYGKNKGKKRLPNHKKATYWNGRSHTAATRAKMSKAQEGNKNNLGKKRGAETILKMSANSRHSKKVININNSVVFPSIRQAADYNGIPEATLSGMLRGHRENKTNLRYETSGLPITPTREEIELTEEYT